MNNRHPPKTNARLAVEAALKQATIEHPLSSAEVSQRSGVCIALTRKHIINCINSRTAFNLRPGERPAVYAWGQAVKPQREQRETLSHRAPYTGEPAKAQRPGAMDAYLLPSLHQGERIARKAPMLIGSIG